MTLTGLEKSPGFPSLSVVGDSTTVGQLVMQESGHWVSVLVREFQILPVLSNKHAQVRS